MSLFRKKASKTASKTRSPLHEEKPRRAAAAATANANAEEEEEDEALEHISDRQDHGEHEVRVLHNMLPLSAAASPVPKRTGGQKSPRRRSILEEDEDSALSLANSSKFNSTSTLFVDSTVSSPDLEQTLRCVGLSIHYIVKDGHTKEEPQLYGHKFDEKRFPLTESRVRSDYAQRIPKEEDIYRFMSRIFTAATLSAECAIITLVYVNRAVAYTNLTLHASNWKRVLLGAILMASKVWDDQAVWNVDFCTILPKIDVEDMNELERTYLEMLDFNIDVDSSVYAKYYFELRALAEKFHKDFPLTMLSKSQAETLEAMSERRHDLVRGMHLRPAKSLDADAFTSKAVLS